MVIFEPDFIKIDSPISFKKYNLFMGKNGAGKSAALTEILIKNFSRQNRSFIIDETRNYQTLTRYSSGSKNLESSTTNSIFDLENDLDAQQINTDLNDLFQRTVSNQPHGAASRASVYIKKDGTPIPIIKDGRGITNARMVLQYIALSKNDMPLLLEEPSLGLYPALVPKFLDIIFQRLSSKNMLFFGTSQDIFVSLYFLSKMYDANLKYVGPHAEYAIFNFKEKENENGEMELTMKEFSPTDEQTILHDLFGDFVGIKEYGMLGLMSNKSSR